ncbi:Acyl-coenzyme A thioesterase 1 [Armadillidium vulgare]|nr:Acyl-coenzyme A thioesterase 1 [Armadillidium vulgare]
MGPIGALSPAPNTYKYNRYMKGDVTTPLVVNFKLLKGHVNEEEAVAPDSDIILDSVKHERIYMTEKTTRIPIREGRLRGTLFIPEGEGPFPGVIDVFGVAGGLLEYRSAQLASRGIASLTLAYFAFEDLPKKMEEVDLSYFEEGVDFLLSHPKIKKSGIGSIGVSKGADIANFLAPDLLGVRDSFYDSDDFPETHFPLHKSEAKYLFLCAKEDGNYKTDFEVDKAVARMEEKGKTDYEVIKYDGAGHLMEPPYAPFSLATFHRVASSAVAWGGNSKDHTEAQIDSWRRIVEFFKRNIV